VYIFRERRIKKLFDKNIIAESIILTLDNSILIEKIQIENNEEN
jgi:hypothetical protein